MVIDQGNCIKYISQIKEFKEVKDNPNLNKLVDGLQNQIKKFADNSEKNEGGDKNEATSINLYLII